MQLDRVSSWRMRLISFGFAAMALVIAGRLVMVQVVEHGKHESAANRTWTVPIHAPRGALLDRNGFPLATSVDTWEVHVDTRVWRRAGNDPTETSRRLALLLDLPERQILDEVATTDGHDAFLAVVPYATGAAIRQEQLPGVYVVEDAGRRYLEGGMAAQVIGVTGRDDRGLAGLEYSLDRLLAGEEGLLVFEQDGIGDPIPFGARAERPARQGLDVVLTLDRNIQRMAERHLAQALKQWEASSGVILVMDVETGDLLAVASSPSYDPSKLDFSDPDLDTSLLRSTVATDVYEPGSVFKVVTMAAGLDSGTITPETTFVDTGAVVVAGQTIRNFDLAYHGPQTMTQVMQRSLNTGTVWVANRMGSEQFERYVRAFGFGEATGSELPGESEGILTGTASLSWSPSQLATNSFGQGIAVTPLQIVQAVGAIANGGELVRPRLVRAVVSGGEVEERQPTTVRRVMSEAAAAQLRQMMHLVVDGVANHPAQTPGWRVAGKSGTTDVVEGGRYVEGQSIASFAGFAPLDEPRVAVLVRIDRPQKNLYGGVVAAPVFSRVVSDVLPYLEVPPTAYVAKPGLYLDEGADGQREMPDFQPARRAGGAR